jgi:hypothetical protein
MNTTEKARIYNNAALNFGLWFLFTSWYWGYFANLFLSYPFGIAAFLFWRQGKRLNPQSILNKLVGGMLLVGLLSSAISFYLGYPHFI